MKVIIGVGVLLLTWILGYYLHLLPIPEPEIFQFIGLGLISVFQPAGIFWTIKRSYDSSSHLSEQLEIDVVPELLKIRGESFYTELLWEKLFKIHEEKDFILFYQNTLSAVIIDKQDLNESELHELKTFLKSIPKVPVHLRKG